jgi:hypothetical protein
MLSERRNPYFSTDFFPARSAFHERVETAGGRLEILPLDATGPNGEKLILNPFGMAWLRRVNENNADLNRNSLGHGEYAGSPEAYPRLDPFLNPPSPPSRDLYLLKAAWLVLRHGMPALRQTVAGGQ